MSELERAGLSALAPAFAADPRPTVDPPYPGRLLRLGSSGPEVALELKGLHPAGGRASGRTAASGKEEWSAWRSRSSRV